MNKEEFSELTGLSYYSLSKYINLGMPAIKMGRSFEIQPKVCLEWVENYHKKNGLEPIVLNPEISIENDIDPGDEGDDYDIKLEPKHRKMVADAELAELKVLKEKGLVVAIQDVEEIVKREYDNVRASLVQIPGTAANRIAEELNQPEMAPDISAILFDEVQSTLNNLTRDEKWN